MGKIILFSPVGGTDPISLTNYHDGSMLHICRVFQPDKVYLYMSKEMLEFQEKDNRYRYCLDKLSEQQHRKMEYEVIERSELTNVQEFDFFYEDFRKIIKDIMAGMEDEDTLLLNISSGTPAMKSGLLVLTTLGEFPCKSIQVATPVCGINEHMHRGYDVEVLWELNEDNRPDFENRCKIVQCPTLSLIKNEEIIKKHIEAFDYPAALEVARMMPKEQTMAYIDFLEMGVARVALDFKTALAIAAIKKIDCFPIMTGNQWKYFEYTLNLDLKLRRKEYADFIRGITPIIVDLFELILKKYAGIIVDDYCKIEKEGIRKWNPLKLRGTDVLDSLSKNFKNDFKYGYVYSEHLKVLIDSFINNGNIKKLVHDLRYVEEKIRNIAAHNIVSIKDETIKEKTGFSSKTIMDKLKKALSYTDIKVKSDYWNSYDEMNQLIINAVNNP